jgi:hypothetical protein
MTYGPIDFLALEFKNENLKGEILPALLDLVNKKIVRIIDLVVIQKKEDGTHTALEMNQLTPELMGAFAPLRADVTGIIQVEDIDGIAEIMQNGSTAAALLFENLWAVQFKEAVLKAKGRLLEQTRVPGDEVEAALAKIGAVEAATK